MGRFFNREAAVVAVSLAVAGVAIGLLAGLTAWLVVAVTVGMVAVLHWPLTMAFQSFILEFYVERQMLPRALELAIEIRDSSVVRSQRQKATLDVAFVHLARGDFENALKNLRQVIPNAGNPKMKAVIEGTHAYTLAHLGRDLDQAEERVRSALSACPGEVLFEYFLALIRFRQGRLAEAKEGIEKTLEKEKDPTLPYPGERAYVLGLVLKGLGDAVGAKASFEKASKAKSHFGTLAAQELSERAA